MRVTALLGVGLKFEGKDITQNKGACEVRAERKPDFGDALTHRLHGAYKSMQLSERRALCFC